MKDYKNILTELYSRYNPEKIANIPNLLNKYNGNEKELICSLFKKYSANPWDYSFFKHFIESNFKEFISTLYGKFNPDKLSELDILTEKYKDNKELFIKQFITKYKIDPPSLINFIDFEKIESLKTEDKLKFNEGEQEKIIESIQSSQTTVAISTKKSQSRNVVIAIATIILIGGSVGGFLLYNNIHTTNLKLAREKQLADSIHVADSIAIAIAKQQRISDSIANNQRMNQNADNEIISRITDVINLLYKYSQENNLNDLQNLFSDNIEQYYSLKDINVEMVVKDREAFSKRFSLSSYQIDFSKLKVLSDKERTYFEVSYDITTVVNKLNSNAKTKFIESITMKLNNVYKIYYITEVVNSKEDI